MKNDSILLERPVTASGIATEAPPAGKHVLPVIEQTTILLPYV
jgi:hypothetical protein